MNPDNFLNLMQAVQNRQGGPQPPDPAVMQTVMNAQADHARQQAAATQQPTTTPAHLATLEGLQEVIYSILNHYKKGGKLLQDAGGKK